MAFRYLPAARWLHWITAGLVLVMLVLGVWITRFEPHDEAFKLRLYNIHESTGVVVFVVVLIRLAFRLTHPPAPLPARVPQGVRFLARANHILLYAVLLIQPVLGFLTTNAWGFPLTWYGVVPIPSPIGKNEAIAPALSFAHWLGAVILCCLIVLHVSGAFYHAVLRRDGVAQRML